MATEIWVDIGSGNGLLPDGTKPLPEPMLTDHQWGSGTFILGQFHKICLNHQSLKFLWNCISKIPLIFPWGQWVNILARLCVCRKFRINHSISFLKFCTRYLFTDMVEQQGQNAVANEKNILSFFYSQHFFIERCWHFLCTIECQTIRLGQLPIEGCGIENMGLNVTVQSFDSSV